MSQTTRFIGTNQIKDSNNHVKHFQNWNTKPSPHSSISNLILDKLHYDSSNSHQLVLNKLVKNNNLQILSPKKKYNNSEFTHVDYLKQSIFYEAPNNLFINPSLSYLPSQTLEQLKQSFNLISSFKIQEDITTFPKQNQKINSNTFFQSNNLEEMTTQFQKIENMVKNIIYNDEKVTNQFFNFVFNTISEQMKHIDAYLIERKESQLLYNVDVCLRSLFMIIDFMYKNIEEQQKKMVKQSTCQLENALQMVKIKLDKEIKINQDMHMSVQGLKQMFAREINKKEETEAEIKELLKSTQKQLSKQPVMQTTNFTQSPFSPLQKTTSYNSNCDKYNLTQQIHPFQPYLLYLPILNLKFGQIEHVCIDSVQIIKEAFHLYSFNPKLNLHELILQDIFSRQNQQGKLNQIHEVSAVLEDLILNIKSDEKLCFILGFLELDKKWISDRERKLLIQIYQLGLRSDDILFFEVELRNEDVIEILKPEGIELNNNYVMSIQDWLNMINKMTIRNNKIENDRLGWLDCE